MVYVSSYICVDRVRTFSNKRFLLHFYKRNVCGWYSRTLQSQCLYVTYTLWPHASSWEQMMCDPVNKCANVGVDAGLVLLAAAVSPAHHTDNIVGPVALAHQRAARVPLQGRRGGFHQGSPPLFFYHHKKKQNHTLSLSQTWQESTPPFMLPAQNMLSSSESPYTWGALHFSWEIRTTRASSSWLVPYFSETGRETVKL